LALAQGAQIAPPSQLYIVSVFFSDYGPAYYYRLLEVTPEGSGSLVRYTRVATVNIYCPRTIVQSAEARLPNTPAELTAANNPCGVRQKALSAASKRYHESSGFETISFGIVAQCGVSLVTLAIPEGTPPDKVRLANLAEEIGRAAFGADDIFYDRNGAADLSLQSAGDKLVPELISGRYDAGLRAAADDSESFRSLLEPYRGPITAAEADAIGVPRLLHPEAFQFSHFVAPKYSKLAWAARISGIVELRLTVDPATAKVLDVAAVSGHPLLKPSAIEAAKQWCFQAGSIHRDSVTIALEYTLRCP